MRLSQKLLTMAALAVACVCSGCCSKLPAVQAESINVTVDDSGPFVYKPQALWHSSATSSRSTQKAAELAYHGTWHYAMNVPSLPLEQYDEDYLVPFEDIESTDLPVTVEFNFTGSAIYLYSSLPLGNTSPSTLVNLTYTLDSVYAGRYIHDGSRFATGFSHNVTIFSRNGLENGSHSLRVDVGCGSVFFFDYVVYTEERPTAGVLAMSDHSQNIMPRSDFVDPMSSSNSNKGATSAVAIGATAGVLFVLGVGLAFNLYRRRKLSKRRDLDEQEELGEQSLYEGQSGRMHGPAPFIPRYFPGTLPPPPPYDPLSTQLDALPTPSTPSYTPREVDDEGSYADHPPPTPPQSQLHGEGGTETPPPFCVAIATPSPPGLTELISHDDPSVAERDTREARLTPATDSVRSSLVTLVPLDSSRNSITSHPMEEH